MGNSELIKQSPEANIDSKELESIHNEQHEKLRESLEKAEVAHASKSQETLSEAHQEALDSAKSTKEATLTERSPAEKRKGIISPRQRDNSFNKQMENINPHLSQSERKFSKVIHNKAVENTSDALSKTVARPNALLAGSICAFITVTLIYVIAKHYGYKLSGFETIAAFALGWILGLIYDYVRLLIRTKKQ